MFKTIMTMENVEVIKKEIENFLKNQVKNVDKSEYEHFGKKVINENKTIMVDSTVEPHHMLKDNFFNRDLSEVPQLMITTFTLNRVFPISIGDEIKITDKRLIITTNSDLKKGFKSPSVYTFEKERFDKEDETEELFSILKESIFDTIFNEYDMERQCVDEISCAISEWYHSVTNNFHKTINFIPDKSVYDLLKEEEFTLSVKIDIESLLNKTNKKFSFLVSVNDKTIEDESFVNILYSLKKELYGEEEDLEEDSENDLENDMEFDFYDCEIY